MVEAKGAFSWELVNNKNGRVQNAVNSSASGYANGQQF